MPLTPSQLSELERLIAARRRALETETHSEAARARDETFQEVAGPVTDSADEAAADLVADVDNAEVTRDLQEMRALEAAQARIADGSYGVCVQCGADIAYARLRAAPDATRCIDCQRVHEKTYAHPGEPTL